MPLELHHRAPLDSVKSTPILFVHGAWHDLWCWDDYFMPYFTSKGYHTYALSLRGHGKSSATKPMCFNSAADYTADVAQVTSMITAQHGTPPILFGHSMGGYITQRYLEAHPAPAAVLVASLPVTGCLRFLLKLLRHDPLRALRCGLTLSLKSVFDTPQDARQWLFSEDVPEELVQRWHARLGDESLRVGNIDATFAALPRPERVRAPLLVLGAANDRIFDVDEQQATARAYGTQAVIFPRMAHNMMQETRWQEVADHSLNWLHERGL
jgi:alpha-beta hydrolase superfamily lysophospholipase